MGSMSAQSQLKTLLKEASLEFRVKALNEIKDGERRIPGERGEQGIGVNKRKVITALNLICPSRRHDSLVFDFSLHFEELQRFIPLCSTAKAFRTAWNLRSQTLSHFDADVIVNEGGQVTPMNKGSRIFECIQQGLELGPNKRLPFAFRHVEGNYDDKLDEMGKFTYQPPRDVTGMLRYRWCQMLSKKLPVPLIVLVIMWFRYRLDDSRNHLFVMAPAKVTSPEEDLKNLDQSLHNPLKLQLISRVEAYSTINVLQALNDSQLEIRARRPIPDEVSREYSYEKITVSPKGRNLKEWAKKVGKRCPGECCNQRPFSGLNSQDIAFGHIISQNWARAFNFLLDKVDHPDNLYLTCRNCNSSLSQNFPNADLRQKIEKQGTIGDWLRGNLEGIRLGHPVI